MNFHSIRLSSHAEDQLRKLEEMTELDPEEIISKAISFYLSELVMTELRDPEKS